MSIDTSASRPSRPRRLRQGAMAFAVAATLVALTGLTSSPAFADEYPTWDDVKNAQADESTKVASTWLREEKLETAVPNPPKITVGEVVVNKPRELVHA